MDLTGFASVAFVFSLLDKNSYVLPESYYAFVAVISGIWLIEQCLSEGKAIEAKDFVEAKKALNSMCLFVIFCLIFVIGIFVFIQRNTYYYQNWFQRKYWAFIVGYVILMSIQIGGARKVKKLLEKRDTLDFELFIRYGDDL